MFAQKKLSYIRRHKIRSAIIAVFVIAVLFFVGAKIFKKSGLVSYVTVKAEKGTLIVSVSGSGQVSVSNQVDIKPKVSGDVIYIGVKNSEEVKAGTLIAQLDARDARKAVRDAQINLDSAKLALAKMQGITTDEGTIRGIGEKASDDLAKAREDGFNTVSNAFLDLPDIMAGLSDVLFSSTLGGGQRNADFYAIAIKDYDENVFRFRDDAFTKYDEARAAYDKNFTDYKSVSRFSNDATAENIINETYDTAKLVAEAVKSASNLIQFYQDKLIERNLKPQSLSYTHLTSLATWTTKISSQLSNLLNIKNSIQSTKETFAGIKFDLNDQQIKVNQAENALLDAKDKLADYFVRAPFDGVIAKLNGKKGDSVSPATVLGTLITKQKIAEISLNEVDVAKVKVGEKVTLTFDAIPDFSITGAVAEMDTIGTVSQGVVTYTVKIAFDTQDERVKPGMSVLAAIITEAKTGVILVPASAVKSQGQMNYVEIPEGAGVSAAPAANAANAGGAGITLKNSPRRANVQIGGSNDEFIEIVSGLKEGEIIVARTIQPSAGKQAASSQQNSLFRLSGGGGGGNFRTGGGAGR